MTWTVDFYEECDGSAPVEAFLARLPLGHRAKDLAGAKLLEEMGPNLPFPYSSQVRGRIRELRSQQGKDKIRILYFADKRRRFILLHGFIKRTDRLDKNEVEIAEQREWSGITGDWKGDRNRDPMESVLSGATSG